MKKTILNFKSVMPILDSYDDMFTKDQLKDKTIIARLDVMGWGKSTNLFLLFSIEDKRFKSSVFHSSNYSSRDKKTSFRDENLIGKTFELKLKISKTNYLDIESAKVINEEERSSSPF